MASHSALIAVLVAVSCAAAASATTYTVGDTQGWTTNVDYSGWTSGKNFAVGDKLLFNFASAAHTVTEVSKSNYESCSSSNAISSNSNGPATVTLSSPGTHYFICGVPGHCSGGMKLAVDVGGSSSGGSPSTPGTSPSSPNGASARMQAAPALAVAAGVLVKLALF
ncbi:hypothetical protein PR202_ga21302 [Eleusine coracana subsp. coracana]|uniref:Phytocyanin domain-containing protein n=1 Tax=Eleusine coracana subsp. coracana TaxID=191504 RepID=A0AAV5D1A3_ELECO|nr:hypothetical protein QOZ80_8AG0634770 [Eleusine coracana subsp. coracana]GJN03820.1 hypothetical protein PR202_ga21302 [Eleusine coracana subsp. coracana]